MAAPLRDPLEFSPDGEATARASGASGPTGLGSLPSRPSQTAAPGVGGLSLGLPRSRRGQARQIPGSGASAHAGPTASNGQDAEDAVRMTDSDALISRYCAWQAGYFARNRLNHELTADFLKAASGSTVSAQGNLAAPSWRVLNQPGQGSRAVQAPSYAAARRPPIINIGTTLRCNGIDDRIAAFALQSGQGRKVQIISLGAGSDDRVFRVKVSSSAVLECIDDHSD